MLRDPLEDAVCGFGDSHRLGAYKGETCGVSVEVLSVMSATGTYVMVGETSP
jgi:hypothetical protein